ncbi:hypothetical protein PISMIDRAFT_683685 [Pisolithus microcarpus 441]|uniref:Uncharacterized protein n=1 Tax=Pisolithus microcarpus 441 TaxID=765257 RepID=A0A0C9Z970_9AGAM|nr:hypothetical protein PISMIDRAFT_683685 [Pisolithus microcarpus 441]
MSILYGCSFLQPSPSHTYIVLVLRHSRERKITALDHPSAQTREPIIMRTVAVEDAGTNPMQPRHGWW